MRIARFLLWSVPLIYAGVQAAERNIPPSLAANLVCHYDFDHPVPGDAAAEADQGSSGTPIRLVNGGAAMRVDDPAFPGAGNALQTRQVGPADPGNDDWKAGLYAADGVATLHPFNAAAGITLMGWIKPTGVNPNPDTTTADPADNYNAIGLFGLLSGSSEGHLVRALLEIISVAESQRLVALGRREDDGNSYILAAQADWEQLLPRGTWTHLAATFDFDAGTMALFRNGEPVPASYTATGDPWLVAGEPEPDLGSGTDPRGIKIGGSFPQNTQERNAFNGRFDELKFFDRALTAAEVRAQFLYYAGLQEAATAESQSAANGID